MWLVNDSKCPLYMYRKHWVGIKHQINIKEGMLQCLSPTNMTGAPKQNKRGERA